MRSINDANVNVVNQKYKNILVVVAIEFIVIWK